MRFKKHYKAVVAIALVLAIGVSLWFSSPVRALTIDVTNPTKGYIGVDYDFTVEINIEDNELLPIQNVNLEIYNIADPGKKATCTDLPLVTGTKLYPASQTGGGRVNVDATSGADWGWGYGYGYAFWKGYAYYFFQPGGYGYGYGPGPASMTYDIIWTPPAVSAWVGNYKIDVEIVANGVTFIETSDQFQISTVPAGGGPGGAPPKPKLEIETNLFGTEGEWDIDKDGVMQETIEGTSEDGNLTVTLPEGTTALDEDGEPLDHFDVTVIEPPPDPPEDKSIIGLAYDFEPDGATFDPALIMTWRYDPAELEAGIAEEDLDIAFYDEDTGQWVVIDCGVKPAACVFDPSTGACCVVDPATNSITIQVTHLTTYAILVPAAPPAFTVSSLSVTPAEVGIGETATISTVITNTGDLAGSYEVALKINGVVEQTKEVTLIGGARQTVTFTTSRDIAGTYAVNVNGQVGAFTVKAPPVPATFTVSNLSVTPAEVEIGETVTISAVITNVGELAGSYEVALKVNGAVEAKKEITLAGGQNQKVTFTTSGAVRGGYVVEVDGQVGEFRVKTPPPPPPPPLNWWVIGGIIAACAIVIGVVIWRVLKMWLIVRHRRAI